jgi:predicted nicotinamide N-methyase
VKLKMNGDFVVNGQPMFLQIEKSERSHSATGLNVWDGGICLAKYLERLFGPRAGVPGGGVGKRALELGCGTGVAGLSLSLLGYDTTLSDIGADQARATEANIAMNAQQMAACGGRACYKECDWRNLPPRESFGQFDLVVCSDVAWHESLCEPLVKAVAWAGSGPGFREFVMGHKVRDQESLTRFEQEMAKNGFMITKVLETKEVMGEWGHPDVILYHAVKA